MARCIWNDQKTPERKNWPVCPTVRKTTRSFAACRVRCGSGLAEAIGDLPERERLVMTLYYYEEMTMKEIGLTLGVVESRVSQIHASAVLHLRTMLADLAARSGGMQKAASKRANARTAQSAKES